MWGFLACVFAVAVVTLVVALLVRIDRPLDDTDNKVTGQRSNMRILIDHGTGCQYLRSPGGGLTPRLDAAGKPMCKGAP